MLDPRVGNPGSAAEQLPEGGMKTPLESSAAACPRPCRRAQHPALLPCHGRAFPPASPCGGESWSLLLRFGLHLQLRALCSPEMENVSDVLGWGKGRPHPLPASLFF